MIRNIEGIDIQIPNEEELALFNERHASSYIYQDDKVVDIRTGKKGILKYSSSYVEEAQYSIEFEDGSSRDVKRKDLQIVEFGDIGLRESENKFRNIRHEITNRVNIKEIENKREETNLSLEEWKKSVISHLNTNFGVPKEFISFQKNEWTDTKVIDVCIDAPSISTIVGSYTYDKEDKTATSNWNILPSTAKRLNESFDKTKPHLDAQVYKVVEKDGLISIEQNFRYDNNPEVVTLSKEESKALNKKLDTIYLSIDNDSNYLDKRKRINSVLAEEFSLKKSNTVDFEQTTVAKSAINNSVSVESQTISSPKEGILDKFKNFMNAGKDALHIALLYVALPTAIIKDKIDESKLTGDGGNYTTSTDVVKNKIQSLRSKHFNTNDIGQKATI